MGENSQTKSRTQTRYKINFIQVQSCSSTNMFKKVVQVQIYSSIELFSYKVIQEQNHQIDIHDLNSAYGVDISRQICLTRGKFTILTIYVYQLQESLLPWTVIRFDWTFWYRSKLKKGKEFWNASNKGSVKFIVVEKRKTDHH